MARRKFFEQHGPALFIVGMLGVCWALQRTLWPEPVSAKTQPPNVFIQYVESPRSVPVTPPIAPSPSTPLVFRTGVTMESASRHANMLVGQEPIRSAMAVASREPSPAQRVAPANSVYYVINRNTYVPNSMPATSSSVGSLEGNPSSAVTLWPSTSSAVGGNSSSGSSSRIMTVRLPLHPIPHEGHNYGFQVPQAVAAP